MSHARRVDGKAWPAALYGLAGRQHGVVARAQLLKAGLSPEAIDNRVRDGWLRSVHRGVYGVGPIAAPGAAEMAAVLACGEEAVLSHRSAAGLWQLLAHPAADRPLEVTVPARHARRRPGVRVHRTRGMSPDEATTLKGIPITTPARTVLDLAANVQLRDLEQALAQVQRRRLASRSRLVVLLARHPRRPGAAVLRTLLEREGRPALTRSRAEERLLRLLRRAELAAPDINGRIGPYEVDFVWRAAGLVVEVDGFDFHGDRAAFEADRRRDAELVARGFKVIRVTWRQIVDEPEATLVRIGQALARLPDGLG
ncbi:MAG: DUF559 domain-containing protein [Solirubrobacterales bacterium]